MQHYRQSPELRDTMSEEEFIVRDSNGTILQDGDNVTVIKDLKVKGSTSGLKRGTMIKGIRLNPYGGDESIECRVDKIKGLMLKPEYVKKV